MDDLWALALGNLTSLVIVGLLFIVTVLITYVLILKYSHFISKFYKKKNFKIPGPAKRLLAFCLDYLVLNIIATFLLMIFVFTLPESKIELNTYLKEAFANDWFRLKYDFVFAQYILLAVYCFYSLISELSSWNGTLAMNRTDMKVVNMKGEKPKPVQLFTRNLVKYGVIVYWPYFIVFIYFNSDRRWLHEIVSRTKTVEV